MCYSDKTFELASIINAETAKTITSFFDFKDSIQVVT